MKRQITVALIALVASVAALALVVGLRQQDEVAAPAPVVSDPTGAGGLARPFEPFAAPRLEGRLLSGTGRASLAALRGQPVVVNFWASWCEPCRREADALVAFARAHPDVRILGVNYQDAPDAARAFARDEGFTWPSIVDSGAGAERFRLPALPGTYVVDADGRVVDRILGEVTASALAERVRGL